MFITLPLNTADGKKRVAVRREDIVRIEEVNEKRCRMLMADNTVHTVRMSLTHAVGTLTAYDMAMAKCLE